MSKTIDTSMLARFFEGLKGIFIKTVNGNSVDENGNVNIDVGVKTINNSKPDDSGNVSISTSYNDLTDKPSVMSLGSNITVTKSTHLKKVETGNSGDGFNQTITAVTNCGDFQCRVEYARETRPGVTAGTRTLQATIQELINMSHIHYSTKWTQHKYNCDCNCD